MVNQVTDAGGCEVVNGPAAEPASPCRNDISSNQDESFPRSMFIGQLWQGKEIVVVR